MAASGGSFVRSIARFATTTMLTAVGLIAIGYWPTLRIAGQDAVTAMIAGVGLSMLTGCLGAIPIALAVSQRSVPSSNTFLASTAIRFLAVLLLVVPLTLSGWVLRTPFVLWVAISYLLMLLVDTTFALRTVKRTTEVNS